MIDASPSLSDIDALVEGRCKTFAAALNDVTYDTGEPALEWLTSTSHHLEGLQAQEQEAERRDAIRALADKVDVCRKHVKVALGKIWLAHETLLRETNSMREVEVSPRPERGSGWRNSKTERIRERTAIALHEHGPLHRKALLKIMLEDGLVGTEQNPMSRLATVLGASRDLFNSNGCGTYSLVRVSNPEQSSQPGTAGLSRRHYQMPPCVKHQQEGGEGVGNSTVQKIARESGLRD